MQEEIRETYLSQGGKRCPYCLSREIEDCGNLVVHEDGRGWVDIHCKICNSLWFNTYQLVGVVEMPLFQHDCAGCVYLGRKNGHDLYYCAGAQGHVFIARFGNGPEDLKSGAESGEGDAELGEALQRTILHNLTRLPRRKIA